jgi:hypothetical protein
MAQTMSFEAERRPMTGLAEQPIASAVIASAATQSIGRQESKSGLPWGFGALEFSNNFFGSRLGVRLGGGIVRRHEAGRGLAPDETAGLPIRGYRRPPMSWPAFVSDDRKLGYLGQIASGRGPRANGAAMSTAVSGCLAREIVDRPPMLRRRDLVGGIRLLYSDTAGELP